MSPGERRFNSEMTEHPPRVTIRRADETDLESFANFADAAHREECRTALRSANAVVLVAEHPQHGICGELLLRIHPDHRATIDTVSVDPRRRGAGIGTALLAAAEAAAERSDCGSIDLGVDRENVGAIRLYDRLGYAAVGEKSPSNGRPFKIMEKPLR
jgi:ribosomal protein S18 acetylase RimI-like enzyme